MKITLATHITFIRILLTPFIVYEILTHQWEYGLGLFVLAMLTDLLDGFVARRYQQESKIGQLLDPVADKILIVSSMFALLFMIADPIILYALYFLIIKEFVLLGGGAILYTCYAVFIKPSLLSRAASIAEMVLILTLIMSRCMGYEIPLALLYCMIMAFCMLSVLLLVRYGLYVLRLLRK